MFQSCLFSVFGPSDDLPLLFLTHSLIHTQLQPVSYSTLPPILRSQLHPPLLHLRSVQHSTAPHTHSTHIQHYTLDGPLRSFVCKSSSSESFDNHRHHYSPFINLCLLRTSPNSWVMSTCFNLFHHEEVTCQTNTQIKEREKKIVYYGVKRSQAPM